jgi:AhpD family alkylhydroperoxidase
MEHDYHKSRSKEAEVIRLKNTGKELYSLKEIYWIYYNGMRTVKYLGKARKNKEISKEFTERIMLATTEVNDCPLCSYAHTRIAFEAGISSKEISDLLSGVSDGTPKHELQAILFAQHYADSRGNPTKASWKQIEEFYGESTAKGVLGAIRIIMLGNAVGIPIGSFMNRFKGKADIRSSLSYEISVLGVGLLFTPIALVHALCSEVLKKPLI